MLVCPTCGSEFEPKHRVGRPRVYCSDSCRAIAARARREARQVREISEVIDLLKALTGRDGMTPAD